MQNIYTDKPNISERILRLLHPIFGLLAKRWPERFEKIHPNLPHASAMLTEKNWVYNFLFPRFYARISVDDEEIERLRDVAKQSTVVFVAKQMGHLEYNYFNELFLKKNLPLCVYTNALTLRRWMRWNDYWKAIIAEESEIGEYEHTRDPLSDGKLPEIIANGNCILLRIPESGLADEGLFFTGPIRSVVALIEAQKQSDKPIQIVPLEFLWSRRPKRYTKSLVDILFGEKESPGFIRKTVLFWRNYKTQANATIGRAINLKDFIEHSAGDTDEALASSLRNLLLGSLKTQRQTVTGPPIRPRSWFIHEVLGNEDLDRRICSIAAEHEKPTDDLRDLAERYIKEIAADVDYTYVELMDRIVGMGLRGIYENFDVDKNGLTKAKELYAEGPIIFVPNHKSHVDYLVLSHILYHSGMTIPHIAAGINLSFWPLGKVFRHCGAYFIRRRFRDNPLYRAVLETYLKVLLKEGYSQEFFIEGGRSRTGKLRFPKMGMLAMLKRAMTDADMKKLHIIPISFTYDRIIEQKTYVKESEGNSKEKEKTSHLFRLTKFLGRGKHKHGSTYVRFGHPITLGKDDSDHKAIQRVALEICHQINRHIVVTPATIAAAALLTDARRGVTLTEFARRSELIRDYLKHKEVEFSARFAAPLKTVMQDALAQFASNKLITIQKNTIEPYISIDESKRLPLAFFKNSIIHFMLTIGLVSNIIIALTKVRDEFLEEDLIAEFKPARKLLSHEFRFATRRDATVHVESALAFLESKGAISRISDGHYTTVLDGLWILSQSTSQIRPYLETLYISLQHILQRPMGDIEERTLISNMQRTGNDLLLLGRIRYRESINKFDLSNTLRALIAEDVIELSEDRPGKEQRLITFSLEKSKMGRNLQVELEKLF